MIDSFRASHLAYSPDGQGVTALDQQKSEFVFKPGLIVSNIQSVCATA